MTETFYRRDRFRAPWMIFWVAFGLRVAAVLIGHTYRMRVVMDHFEFGWEMGRIARSLAVGQGFSNPFNGASGPTAWTPPLYPLLMAAAFKMFGVYTNAAALFLMICDSLFSAAIVPAVYEIAARCFDAKGIARRGAKVAAPVAMWSAWMWAVYPAALQYAVHWIWEMSLSTFLFAWVVVVALRLRGVGEPAVKERTSGAKALNLPEAMRPEAEASVYLGSSAGISNAGSLKLWGVFGGLWGLLTLSNASLLLCLPAMMAWVAWPELRRRDWVGVRGQMVGAALACAVFVAVMTPWVVRNERVFHAFVPTRGNLGIEMYCSTLDANDALPWGTTLPLWPGDPEFKEYVRMGEVKFAAMRGAQAKARIAAQPWVFVRRTGTRFLYFWDGTPHPPDKHPAQESLRNLSYSFLSLCGLLGLALMMRRRVEGAGLFAVVFLLVPLPYYLVTVQPRFRHPMEPLIAVLAVFLFRCAEKKTVHSRG